MVRPSRHRGSLRRPHARRRHRSGRDHQRGHRHRPQPGLPDGHRGRRRNRPNKKPSTPAEPCCWSWNGSTTTSPTWEPSPTTSDSALPTPIPNACVRGLLLHNKTLTGHRLLRGALSLGGASLQHPPNLELLRAVAADMADITDLTLGHGVIASSPGAPSWARRGASLGALATLHGPRPPSTHGPTTPSSTYTPVHSSNRDQRGRACPVRGAGARNRHGHRPYRTPVQSQ